MMRPTVVLPEGVAATGSVEVAWHSWAAGFGVQDLAGKLAQEFGRGLAIPGHWFGSPIRVCHCPAREPHRMSMGERALVGQEQTLEHQD